MRSTLLALLLLSGCAAFPQPKGFDQQLATAYGVHTSVVQATTTALIAGTISVKDAEAVQGMEKNARSLLDAAKAAEEAGNPTGASSELALATNALTALQSYLNAKGAK
jgi:hypothetical protein